MKSHSCVCFVIVLVCVCLCFRVHDDENKGKQNKTEEKKDAILTQFYHQKVIAQWIAY